MKYLGWGAMGFLVVAGFAIYGALTTGSSLGFAVTEVGALPLGVAGILGVVYVILASIQRIQRR